jgi:hypothetical protein
MSSSMLLQRLFVNARAAQLRMGSAALQQHKRGFVSATLPLLEKKSLKVPSMGDSITEVSVVLCCVVLCCAVLTESAVPH